MNTPLEKVLPFKGGLVVDQREVGSGDVVVLRADVTRLGQPIKKQEIVWRKLEPLMDDDHDISAQVEIEIAFRRKLKQRTANFTVGRMTREEAREKGLLAGIDVIFMP